MKLPTSPLMELSTPCSMLLCGKTKSGKTHLLRYIMYDLCTVQRAFKYGLVICPTARMSGDYAWMPTDCIHTGYSDALIERVMAHQEKKKRPPMFIILDDCIGSATWNSAVLKKLITTARHYNISVLITTQYMNSIPTIWREQITYSFIFAQHTSRAIKACQEAYLSHKTVREVAKFLHEHTKSYAFLFIQPGGDPMPMRAPDCVRPFKLEFPEH